jgi:hypothetical protein
MADTRIPLTFNHITFDKAKNVELHFALLEDAQAFIKDKIRTQDSVLAITSADSNIKFKISASWSWCCYARQGCGIVTLHPAIFDLYAGRINGQNVYHQLVKLEALRTANSKNAFVETLVKMHPQVQAYALRFILPKPLLLSTIIEASRHLSSGTLQQREQFVEMIRNLPDDVCNEIAILGRCGKFNKFSGVILADNPELFLPFIAKLSPGIRNRSALLRHRDCTTLVVAVNTLSEENLTAYINQLDPKVLTQAAIISTVLDNTNNYCYSIHKTMDETPVTNPALLPFLTIDNNNALLVEFKNLLQLQKEIEDSWIDFFETDTFTFDGQSCEIDLPTSKQIITFIKGIFNGDFFIHEVTELLKRKLNFEENLVTVVTSVINVTDSLSIPLISPSHTDTGRDVVYIKLKQICNDTQNKNIQTLLTGWTDVIDEMTLDEIHSLISGEINNSSSILKEQSSYTFFQSQSELDRVRALLNEIKQIIQVNQTPQVIAKVGMTIR